MTADGRIQRVALLVLIATVCAGGRGFAQTDLAGQWRPLLHEDIGHRLDEASAAPGISGAGGPWIGDYTGLPINDAARYKAESWDARIYTAKEHQTILQPGAYWILSPGAVRISNIIDDATERVIALSLYRAGLAGSTQRTIWMDGRAAPPTYAPHTWQGFSAGTWDGNTLTVTTTRLKAGFIRRNGVPASDRATLTEYFVRHGAYLTVTRIVEDPIYLAEPFISTVTWVQDPQMRIPASPPGVIVDEIPGQHRAFVPHHLPGTNTGLQEFADKVGLPLEATRGGPHTAYPEYQHRLKALMTGQAKTETR
jgi:hypothetical protein